MTFTAREPKDDGRCIDARCSCGCALRLSSKDFADAARCIAQAGPGPYRKVQLQPATEKARKQEKPEPTKGVECPSCGEGYEMAAYLVEALESRKAQAPTCEGCRGGTTKQEEIDTEPHWSDGNGT